MDVLVGYSEVVLEGRFSKLRSEETNLGNFVADLIRLDTGAEAAIINTGTLRTNEVVDAGPLK